MENQTLVEEKPANKNRTLIIVIVAVIVLCCCCAVVAAAGYYFFKTDRFASVLLPPSELLIPGSGVDVGDPPIGGLGNDILKSDTWQVIVPASIGLGCDQPLNSDSTIEVLQQPDANGVWVEKWTVVCVSGDEYAFEVQYTLDDTGATYNIKPLP